jgi:hypothetical protein
MTNENVVPSTEREPETGYLPDNPDKGSTISYPRSGTADPRVGDAAFELDDTDPSIDTAGQGGPQSTGADFSDARRGSDPEHDPINAPYPNNDLLDEPQRPPSRPSGAGTGGGLGDTAREEVSGLAHDVRQHASDLWQLAGDEVVDQLNAGQQRLAHLLHEFAADLGQMAARSDQDGLATNLAAQTSESTGRLAHWLANSTPMDVAGQVRSFARRRPLVFLAGATVAGVLVGRLGRGLAAARTGTAATGLRR